MKINGEGFIFSLDGGATPICRKHMYIGLRNALKKIGISDKERIQRGINIHAWRHFCNTEMQKGGLSVQKVQAVTGHKSEKMTEHYTHFDPSDFGDVPKIQETLLKKSDNVTNERPTLTLIKLPEEKIPIESKQAS
jgi:integrase